MKNKHITCHQAADILGTTTENVRSLAKSGIISSITVKTPNGRKSIYYFENEIKARKEASMEYLRKAIDADKINAAGTSLLKEAKAKEEEIRQRYKANTHWQATQERLSDATLAIIENVEGQMTQLEKTIIRDIIRLVPLEKIAEKHNVGFENIRQIASRAAKKIINGKCMAERLEQMQQTLNQKNKEIELLNAALLEEKKEKKRYLETDPRLIRNLLLTINEVGLSPRSYNALKKVNIRTMADLTKASKDFLMEIPNCGRKSVKEMELLLEKMGLHFGMDVSFLQKQ